MADDPIRQIAIRQGASIVTTFVAGRVRDGARKKPIEVPEPDERPALTKAQQLIGRDAEPDGDLDVDLPMGIPDDLFAGIEDREQAKAVLIAALRSSEPVHVLLIGDAATGKSQLLQLIAKLPRSRYAVGGSTTSAGLLDYLLEKPNTRNLVIDELEKAQTADLYALYSLMESGIVTRLHHDDRVHRVHKVWVFAAANDVSKVPDALLSRFRKVALQPYTDEQIRHINRVIIEREGLPPARAAAIADAVAARSRDPRDARDVARMVGADGDLDAMVEHVMPRKARESE